MRFVLIPFALAACAAAQNPRDTFTATATQDKTPRVAIVLSSFAGSQDHDGTPIPGLAEPRPAGSPLTPAQYGAMVRKALEIGQPRTGGLERIVQPDDWVMLLCARGVPSEAVRAVVGFLVAARHGARITVAAPGPPPAPELAREYPGVRIESVDLEREPALESPAPAGERTYAVSKTLQQCDRVIAIARPEGDMLLGTYLAASRNAPRTPEAMADIFSFHPADYALLAGTGTVVAGANAVAVDAIGAAISGRDPRKLDSLVRAVRLGFGINDPDAVWTRGNTIEEARRR